jgi:hypothetical protein
MKRTWQVKVTGLPPFSMIIMSDDEDPVHICRSIFGDQLIWVR